ncbi:hypothetical protein MP228_007187 [Amoeboaphelidium protococcarum]|nr:hypothetical protein MP228_007187 [Amoeboaphelidium protococcarum]
MIPQSLAVTKLMRLKKTREEQFQPRLVLFRVKRDQLAVEELTLVTATSKASETVSDASITSTPYFNSVIIFTSIMPASTKVKTVVTTGTTVTPTPSGNATAEGNDVNSSSGSISAFLSITKM